MKYFQLCLTIETEDDYDGEELFNLENNSAALDFSEFTDVKSIHDVCVDLYDDEGELVPRDGWDYWYAIADIFDEEKERNDGDGWSDITVLVKTTVDTQNDVREFKIEKICIGGISRDVNLNVDSLSIMNTLILDNNDYEYRLEKWEEAVIENGERYNRSNAT